MKRLFMIALMAILTASTLTGCYGKFNLTRKVYEVNSQVHEKFLRSGLTWLLMPIYGMAGMVDFLFFNTVEFWSGSNPIVFGEKDFQYARGDETFRIHVSKAGHTLEYTIRHYGKTGLLDTTLINMDMHTGKSALSTNKEGTDRNYVLTRDAAAFRIEEYCGLELKNISYYKQAGTDIGEVLAAR